MTNFKNRGVRKVDESIISKGRSLVIDYQASNNGEIEWSDIPAGSLGVDKSNGKVYVKLLDTSWWTEIQAASGTGGLDVPPPSTWEDGDFPLGGMTEGEVLAEIFILKSRIQEIEYALYGLNTTWDEKYYYSDKIRYARTKIFEIAEGMVTGSVVFLRIYPGTNAREAINSLTTICNIVAETITGINESMLQVMTDQINEIYSTIEPAARIARVVSLPVDLLDEIVNIYNTISEAVPDWINNVPAMTDDQIYDLVYKEVKNIQNIIYTRVQSAALESLMLKETIEDENISESDRIASLESQLQSILSIIKNNG